MWQSLTSQEITDRDNHMDGINQHLSNFQFHFMHAQANFGVIHESGKKLGVCYCVEQVHRDMDLPYSSSAWGYTWGLGLQLD